MRRREFCLMALSLAALTGCGFHRRGVVELPFKRLFTTVDEDSKFGAQLRRLIRAASGVTFVDSPEAAEATLEMPASRRSRHVISLNTKGEAREYELTQTMVFRITGKGGREFMPATTFQSSRNMTYNDAEHISRGNEEARLYDEMAEDILTRLINTMGALK